MDVEKVVHHPEEIKELGIPEPRMSLQLLQELRDFWAHHEIQDGPE
jgi:hypothetical protein